MIHPLFQSSSPMRFFPFLFFIFIFFPISCIIRYKEKLDSCKYICIWYNYAWLVFFTLAHTSSHSCTHKIFHNIQKYVIYIVYILSTYSILLLLNVFGCIKITQIHNYQKSDKLRLFHKGMTLSQIKKHAVLSQYLLYRMNIYLKSLH